MFYIFYQGITPNTASGNRFLAFLKGFDELGVKGTAVLLKPSVNNYKIQETFQFIKIKYLWKDWPFAWRVFDKLYRPLAFQRFLWSLKNGDVVFCYGSSLYLTRFRAKEGVRVFHERTESPDVVSLPTPKLQDGYLRACKSLDGLFVISTTLKSYFVNKGVPADKIRIINMTVDSNRFIGLKKNNSLSCHSSFFRRY